MKLCTLSITLVFILLIGCAGRPISNEVVTTQVTETTPTPKAPKEDQELHKQIAAIAKDAKGKVGVYASVLEDEEDNKEVLLNADERFAMQSVVKLPIAMTVLNKIDIDREQGRTDPFQLETKVFVSRDDFVPSYMRSPIRDGNPDGVELSVRQLLRYAISDSDGTAADVLQRLAGGASAVQDFLDLIDIGEMKVKHSHREFGANWELQYENWTTPRGAYELLYTLWLASPNINRSTRHSKESYELLVKYMTESNNPPNRLKGMLPPGTPVAHKTGTGGTRNGITSATNDVGIITLPNGKHVAIAVFVGDSSADERTRERVIARIAKAVFDTWAAADAIADAPANSPN